MVNNRSYFIKVILQLAVGAEFKTTSFVVQIAETVINFALAGRKQGLLLNITKRT